MPVLTASLPCQYNVLMLRTICAVILIALCVAGCANLARTPTRIPRPTPTLADQTPTLQPVQPHNVPNRLSRPALAATRSSTVSATPAANFNAPIVYGRSFNGRPLAAYRLGYGSVRRALIGGLHGGYEWNTTVLMSQTLEYLVASPDSIPEELTLYIIPLANPDGAAAGSDRVAGRMNGNGVDLNRNWDYRWQTTATHGVHPVGAGAFPFSEPETAALRDFILGRGIGAAIFYHSAAAEVYSGAGTDTSGTVALAKALAAKTGYRYAPEGIPDQITTGNAIDWLTTQGITALEIELPTHADIDWEPNLKAILAFMSWSLSSILTAE